MVQAPHLLLTEPSAAVATLRDHVSQAIERHQGDFLAIDGPELTALADELRQRPDDRRGRLAYR